MPGPKEPMELAKNWDEQKYQLVLPAYASLKWDGVPLTFKRQDGSITALTRQNEDRSIAVPHLVRLAGFILLTEGASFTAECLIPGAPFKDSSGAIRTDAPQPNVVAKVFDANIQNRPMDSYYTRIRQFEVAAAALDDPALVAVDRRLVETVHQVDEHWDNIKADVPDAEGMMLHKLDKPFQPGKRCWGMGRYKPQPTIDLQVVGFEEAVSEDGIKLGMVGRVNVKLRRRRTVFDGMASRTIVAETIVGVGPGKTSHEERKILWEKYKNDAANRAGDLPLYAEIKYMPDPSYDALRQPTLQRLRTDKTEGDILEYPN